MKKGTYARLHRFLFSWLRTILLFPLFRPTPSSYPPSSHFVPLFTGWKWDVQGVQGKNAPVYIFLILNFLYETG